MRRSIGLIVQMLVCGVLLGGCFLTDPDPAVTMSIEPSAGYSPLPVHVEAHATDADNLSYTWDFGDETMAIGREADHTFAGVGAISVRLIVTDAQGGQTVSNGAVRLLNRLPYARFTYQPNPAPTHHPIPSQDGTQLIFDMTFRSARRRMYASSSSLSGMNKATSDPLNHGPETRTIIAKLIVHKTAGSP